MLKRKKKNFELNNGPVFELEEIKHTKKLFDKLLVHYFLYSHHP